jgi:hypothetical protein
MKLFAVAALLIALPAVLGGKALRRAQGVHPDDCSHPSQNTYCCCGKKWTDKYCVEEDGEILCRPVSYFNWKGELSGGTIVPLLKSDGCASCQK